MVSAQIVVSQPLTGMHTTSVVILRKYAKHVILPLALERVNAQE